MYDARSADYIRYRRTEQNILFYIPYKTTNIMRRILTLIIALIAVCGAANAQVLWQISGKGLKQKSYILGSYHFMPGSFVDSIPGATRVLKSVDQVYGELDSKDAQNPDTVAAIQNWIMYAGDTTLQSICTGDQYQRLSKAIMDNLELDINQPQFGFLFKLRPFMFTTAVTMMGEQMKQAQNGIEQAPQQRMDFYLQVEAVRLGKQCKGLETYGYQMRTYNEAVNQDPLSKQIEDMIETFEKYKESKGDVINLTDAYKKMDLKAIDECVKKGMENSKDIENKMMNVRNENWSRQIPAIIAEKSTLFVVGAGHIAGSKSVLELLKAQGYKIKPVKK